VKLPTGPLHERLEVPDPVTLVGESVHVKPVEGVTVSPSETTPLKPACAVIVTVEVPVAPARLVTAVGLAASVKS